MSRAVAGALPVEAGISAWDSFFRPERLFPSVEQDEACDVLIVGAGFAGLSAARALRQQAPATRIVVLDALRIGEGASGRNAGFMIDLTHDLSSDDYGGEETRARNTIRENRSAIAFALDAAAEYGFQEGVMARTGKVNGACTEHSMQLVKSYARHLDQLGEPYHLLDDADMQRLTGSAYYRSGILTPGTVMIQPAAYIKSLALGLHSQGVRLFENSPVLRLDRSAGLVAHTRLGKITAGRVILATNGHVRAFGHYTNRLIDVTTYASITCSMTGGQSRALGGSDTWSITPAAPHGSTLRRVRGALFGGDRIFYRSVFQATGLHPASPGQLAHSMQEHIKGFNRRFPALKGIGITHTWAGRLCLSRNGASAVAEVEPGLITACCQNGLGSVRGTFNGMRAARIAQGLPDDLTPYGSEQPVKVAPELLLKPGVNAYLSWKRWHDRDEV